MKKTKLKSPDALYSHYYEWEHTHLEEKIEMLANKMYEILYYLRRKEQEEQ